MKLPLLLYALRKAPRVFKTRKLPVCTGILLTYTGTCPSVYTDYSFYCKDENGNVCGSEFRYTTYGGCGYYCECCINTYRYIFIDVEPNQFDTSNVNIIEILFKNIIGGYDVSTDDYYWWHDIYIHVPNSIYNYIWIAYSVGNAWSTYKYNQWLYIESYAGAGFGFSKTIDLNILPTKLDSYVPFDIKVKVDFPNGILEVYINDTLYYTTENDINAKSIIESLVINPLAIYHYSELVGVCNNYAHQHIVSKFNLL